MRTDNNDSLLPKPENQALDTQNPSYKTRTPHVQYCIQRTNKGDSQVIIVSHSVQSTSIIATTYNHTLKTLLIYRTLPIPIIHSINSTTQPIIGTLLNNTDQCQASFEHLQDIQLSKILTFQGYLCS